MPQRVRADGFTDPGLACNPVDDPPGAVPVQPPPICGKEDEAARTARRWPGLSPWRCGERADGDYLAALAGDGQRPVPVFEAQVLDISSGGFRDPQPVEG